MFGKWKVGIFKDFELFQGSYLGNNFCWNVDLRGVYEGKGREEGIKGEGKGGEGRRKGGGSVRLEEEVEEVKWEEGQAGVVIGVGGGVRGGIGGGRIGAGRGVGGIGGGVGEAGVEGGRLGGGGLGGGGRIGGEGEGGIGGGKEGVKNKLMRKFYGSMLGGKPEFYGEERINCNLVFKGNYRNGLPNGKGILFSYPSLTPIFKGFFLNGVVVSGTCSLLDSKMRFFGEFERNGGSIYSWGRVWEEVGSFKMKGFVLYEAEGGRRDVGGRKEEGGGRKEGEEEEEKEKEGRKEEEGGRSEEVERKEVIDDDVLLTACGYFERIVNPILEGACFLEYKSGTVFEGNFQNSKKKGIT